MAVGASAAGGSLSTPSPPSEPAAQPAINRISPARIHRIVLRLSARRRSAITAEADASSDASNKPTGVAMVNPWLGPASRTPGVASACRARKPALASSAKETRNSRASSRVAAASLVITASITLTTATASTSQKCAGRCSHTRSSSGTASSSAKPATGTSNNATAARPAAVGQAGATGSVDIKPTPFEAL
jgi:hypothetical protein